ncbi:hypothetical protein SNEBB_006339 [Seison nebaliae]|nr:hypothetical protein SNEBB_006339 [Seison nebaliae]
MSSPLTGEHVSTSNDSNEKLFDNAKCTDFIVKRRLGKGQFSHVYLAEHAQTKSVVALKKVQIGEMIDTKCRTDCIEEIKLLKALNHPNIIKYHCHFIDKMELNIILELADAGDISTLLKYFRKRDKLLMESSVWKYFVQICRGLNHMHQNKIMHRDIKPANVFINTAGHAKLGDLGLGRFFTSTTNFVQSIVGTPYYMSPERINEEPYDFASDIWSLGCLLYEMAALRSPFYVSNLSLQMLSQKIQKGDYPPLPPDNYSSDLHNLAYNCIAIKARKRPTIDKVLEIAEKCYGDGKCRIDSATIYHKEQERKRNEQIN